MSKRKRKIRKNRRIKVDNRKIKGRSKEGRLRKRHPMPKKSNAKCSRRGSS
jgi:hypothetical protein